MCVCVCVGGGVGGGGGDEKWGYLKKRCYERIGVCGGGGGGGEFPHLN